MGDDYRITELSELNRKQNRAPEDRHHFRWQIFIPVVLLITGIVSGGIYYLILEKKRNTGISKLFQFSNENQREVKIRPSDTPNDLELQKSIQQFKDGYLKVAKSNFYDILQSTKSDEVKSFAAIYLGIISDEEGKFILATDFFNRALKFNNQNFYAYYNLGVALKHSGNYTEAIKALEKAEILRPEIADAQILKGKLHYEAGQLDAAKNTLEHITDVEKNPSAIYNLGKIYKKQGKFTEAKTTFLNALNLAGAGEIAYRSANELGILYASGGDSDLENAREYFKRATALAPHHPKYYYNLALIEYRLNNLKEALQALDNANRYGGQSKNTAIYMAKLYEELGKPEKAERSLRKELDNSPSNIEILSSLADNLMEQNKWDAANIALKKILSKSTKILEKSQVLHNLGIIQSELKNWNQALYYLKRAQSLNPTNDDILTSLGRVYTNSGQPHKAISSFRKALELNPHNRKILEESVKIYLSMGLLSQAEEDLHKILEMSKEQKNIHQLSFAYYNLGKLNKQKKDFDISIEYFEKVLQLRGNKYQYDTLLQISDSILLAKKPPVLSYPYLQKAIALKPREMLPRFLLSKALTNEDTIQARSNALDELLTIIEEENVDPILLSKAHTIRGIIYSKEGLYLKALDDFIIALNIDPSNDEAFQNKKVIAQKLESNN